MRSIRLIYDSETASLSLDGPDRGAACIDNLATEVTVVGIPEGAVADLCYGVQVATEDGAMYPFSRLEDGTARIPGQVMAAANAGRLPVALRLSFDDGRIIGSVNRISLRVTVYPDSIDSAESVMGDRLMLMGDPWEWVAEWTYAKGSVCIHEGRIWISQIDGCLGIEPGTDDSWLRVGTDGISVTHQWDGTVLTVTSASGTSSADLVGPQGPQGERGPEGPPGPDSQPGEAIVRYLGDGASVTYDVIHYQKTTNLIWSLRKDGKFIDADVSIIDEDTLRVRFTSPPAQDSVAMTIVSGGMLNRQMIHEQTTASEVWTIRHSLGRYPQVTILDTTQTEIHGQVRHINGDTVEVAFNSPTRGTAVME